MNPELIDDIINYIEQAQILVEEADQRKGAKVVHGMGERLLRRIRLHEIGEISKQTIKDGNL